MFFDDFFGGGMPHGMGGGMGGQREEVDTDKFYEVLGVEKNATEREIKKAWRKLCKKHHPDRGGDPEKFKDLEKAYDVLSDSDKRQLYDEGGEEAIQRGHAGTTNIFDLFGGGMRGRQRDTGPKKPKPIKHILSVDLEDVFSGSEKKIKITVMSADERNVCSKCRGQGQYMETVRRGPMLMQTQKTCPQCEGRGVSWKNEKKTEKQVDVYVPPGVKDGDKITLTQEGHDLPDMPTGDVIVVLKVKSHRLYQRRGADLAMSKELTLVEALCGYNFCINSIESGEWLRVKSPDGAVVQSGDVICVEERGLPQKGGRIRGNLYIRFTVVLPDSGSLKPSEVAKLQNLLSPNSVTYDMPGLSINDTREITTGAAVRLCGLQNRPDLNGVEGTVLEADFKPGQYAVQLVTGQTVAVRAELIELTDPVETDDGTTASSPLPGDYVEEVSGDLVDDMEKVEHTAVDFGSQYDEDEGGQEGVDCRQM